jgi:hypothetical protein
MNMFDVPKYTVNIGVPTSTMPSIQKYPAIFWKAHRMMRSSIVIEMNNDETGRIMLIVNPWSVGTPRYLS